MIPSSEILEAIKRLSSKELIYQEIMRLGKELPPFHPEWKIESNRVVGCQSMMYLHVEQKEGALFFYAESDALISKGLAALMLSVYNGKPAEWILKTKPTFLDELGLLALLTPSRANGVLSLYQKMQQAALNTLI